MNSVSRAHCRLGLYDPLREIEAALFTSHRIGKGAAYSGFDLLNERSKFIRPDPEVLLGPQSKQAAKKISEPAKGEVPGLEKNAKGGKNKKENSLGKLFSLLTLSLLGDPRLVLTSPEDIEGREWMFVAPRCPKVRCGTDEKLVPRF